MGVLMRGYREVVGAFELSAVPEVAVEVRALLTVPDALAHRAGSPVRDHAEARVVAATFRMHRPLDRVVSQTTESEVVRLEVPRRLDEASGIEEIVQDVEVLEQVRRCRARGIEGIVEVVADLRGSGSARRSEPDLRVVPDEEVLARVEPSDGGLRGESRKGNDAVVRGCRIVRVR